MSNSFHIWKACLRKRAYPSPEAAAQQGQQVYRCKHCSQWHRTSGMNKFVAQLRRVQTHRR